MFLLTIAVLFNYNANNETNELVKKYSNTKNIDILINYNNVIYPIEIKKSANPGKDAIKNFDVANNFEMQKGNDIVLCMTKDIIAYDDNNYIVPIEYI